MTNYLYLVQQFSSKVPPPSVSRWTKDGPVGDRLIVGSIGGVLWDVPREALEPMEATLLTPATESELSELNETVEFNRVSGKWAKRFFSVAGDIVKLMRPLIQAVVREGSRSVIMWILAAAHGAKSFTTAAPIGCFG